MYPKNGFTLLEVLIVILIISILSAVVVPVAYKSVNKVNAVVKEYKNVSNEKYALFFSFVADSICRYDKKKVFRCKNGREYHVR